MVAQHHPAYDDSHVEALQYAAQALVGCRLA
jgi:hypothetical protein